MKTKEITNNFKMRYFTHVKRLVASKMTFAAEGRGAVVTFVWFVTVALKRVLVTNALCDWQVTFLAKVAYVF